MTEASLGLLVPEEKMDLKVQREGLVCQVIQVHLVPLEKRASLVFQGYQDIPEDKVQRGLRVFKVFQEPTEKKEQGEQQANPVQGGSEDQRVLVEREVQGVPLESQGPRATQGVMVQLVLLAKGVYQDLRDPQDSLDQRAHLVPLAKMDFLDTLDREVKLVSKARQVLLGPQVWSDPRVLLVKLDQWESVDTPGPLAPQASRVSQELLEKKV